MKITDAPLEGLKIIELDVHGDDRGFFVERNHSEKFKAAGLDMTFAQDNHSRSAAGILRGLHYQHTPPQGKLVGVTRGAVWDVAVDIRKNSPTYGQHFGIELSDMNGRLFWMPEGFAHGFCVLGDAPADMLYKCTNVYHAAGEGGIRFDDAALNIPWPISSPQISERDKNLPSFADYSRSAPNW